MASAPSPPADPSPPAGRALRGLSWAACAAFVLVLGAAAVVPGPAWSPGSAALEDAPIVTASRILHVQTGLTVEPLSGGEVMVSTGDGGGAGPIDGLDDAPLRVRPASFRGLPAWELGTAAERPATYVDDNGVRLDDGMSDRLRQRAWPVPAVLSALALVAAVLARLREPRAPRWAAPLLCLAATLALASTI